MKSSLRASLLKKISTKFTKDLELIGRERTEELPVTDTFEDPPVVKPKSRHVYFFGEETWPRLNNQQGPLSDAAEDYSDLSFEVELERVDCNQM